MQLIIPLAMVGSCKGGGGKSGLANEVLSFGVIADPQYADQDKRGNRHYRKSLGKLVHAVEELNKHELDFVVTLGDVIDKDLKSFDDIMPLYKKLKAPHNLVIGNHDLEVDDADKPKVMAAMGLAKNYYSEVKKGWRTIYLDGTDVSLFSHSEESPQWLIADKLYKKLKASKVRQAVPWNGAMSDEQIKWFTSELEASKKAGERVIICNHYPIMPAGDSHNLWNAEAVVEIIDKYDHVALYLNGHNHKGNYAERNGTHFVNFKGMVETEKKSAYGVVTCYSDRIEINGYDTEPDRKLS